MVTKREAGPVEEMTPKEERAYWDAQDPLRQGKRVRVRHPEPPADRLSYFALRLSGRDIGRLAELAQKRGMKPSELARALIVQGLEDERGQQDVEKRVALLERDVAKLKKQLAESTKWSSIPEYSQGARLPEVAPKSKTPGGNGSRVQWGE